jgi:uncharacterized RDD family membrane protein YckC
MADTDRLYILKTVDGQEYGPIDQDTLVRWAESGRITGFCQVRSTLLPRWENACDIPFLREILLAQMEEEERESRSLWQKLKGRATMRAVEAASFGGLHHVRPKDFEPAGIVMRFLAGLFDAGVMLGFGIVLYLLFALLYSLGLLYANEAFYLGFIVFYIGVMLYFMLGIAVYAQTVGQHFWGVILIHRDGTQFYVGRAFVYTLFLLCCGPLTPLFMYLAPSRRSLQEIVTGTRMVRVKLVGKRR